MTRRARGFRGPRWESRTGGHFNVIVVMYRMSLALNAAVMVSHVFFSIRRVSGVDPVGWGGCLSGSSSPPGQRKLEHKKVDVF